MCMCAFFRSVIPFFQTLVVIRQLSMLFASVGRKQESSNKTPVELELQAKHGYGVSIPTTASTDTSSITTTYKYYRSVVYQWLHP